MPAGIASWQRQRDLKQLVERIGRSDCKLIVIHGDSGVGKSSLISAGLVPILEQRAIGIQDNLPVMVRAYTDWDRELGQRLARAIEACRDRKRARRAIERGEVKPQSLRHESADDFNQQLDILKSDDCSAADVLGFLRQLDRNNLRTVLIFDQFEEFFFVHPSPAQRRSFFTFLGECLQLLSVNVVLPLREDYLHYLLEFNRIPEICATGIDTLSRTVLYPLGNFSANDAHAIISELTEQARFYLEPALVNELVQDLTDESGEVRPIELQIVGAQLQTEGIRDLQTYRQLRESDKPAKEILVERYLAEVVADCGSDSDRAAELVLYLLTDENNTRPLKTKAELAADMGDEVTRLDLVLDILVRSGLVMLIPEVPSDRYQLVHDYLVPYIRQQQGTNLLAELEQERALRSLTEAELRQTLKQLEKSLEQERQARQRAEIAEVDALSLSSQALFLLHDQLRGMVAGVKAGKKLKDTEAPKEVQLRVIARLRQAVYDIREVNRLHGHGDWVHNVCVSPDGQFLASGSRDRTIKLWNLAGQELRTFSGHTDWVNSVCFSPDGQRLVSGCGDDTMKLWTLDGHELVTFIGHSRGVRSVCFSPDGQMLASGSSDCTIKLWSLDGRELQTSSKHRAEILCVRFSPDGQLLASGNSDNTIRLWSLDGLELETFSSHRDRVVSICFSPDGQTVVSGSGDGTIKLWSLDGEVLQTFFGHGEWVNSLCFSPDGQMLISGSGDRTIRLWSLASRNRQFFAGCGSRVSSVRLSPNNQLLASCGEDDAIRLWSLDGELIRTILGNSAGVNSISFSPDGQTLVSGGGNGMVKLWSLEGQELRIIGKHNRRVKWICFSPDSQLLASRSSSSIKLWNLDGHELAVLYHPNLSGNVVCFSSDGQMVAADVGEGMVKLWDSHGEELHTFHSSIERINSLCFSPDSQSLAIGSGDLGTISLWSLDGKNLRTFLGHSANASYLCYSPNGQILASGSGDRTVKLWSPDGEELQTFSDHSAGVTDICFSPDGRFLASSSCDGTVILRNLELFNLDLDQLTNLGCNWLRNYLRYNPTLSDSDRHLCDNINR
ncbi:MAG: AAA family ATPase [Leptolyngbyaceae cyanobacterium RU_5_1]|nr:AAA family ATPase [Leptolyngbyaceae cyanobacterium RU_5_1]